MKSRVCHAVLEQIKQGAAANKAGCDHQQVLANLDLPWTDQHLLVIHLII